MAQTPSTPPENSGGQNIDWQQQVEYVRGLAGIVSELGLSELEVESDGVLISLKGQTSAPAYVVEAAPIAGVPVAQAAPVTGKAPAKAAAKPAEDLVPVVSPMVGVFYRQPSPADPPFVEVGDRVEKGQVVGLVEAMKSFNEIQSEASGIVAEIKVQNAELVETGAPLLLLRRG